LKNIALIDFEIGVFINFKVILKCYWNVWVHLNSCSMHGGDSKCIQSFCWKTCREETTQKTYT